MSLASLKSARQFRIVVRRQRFLCLRPNCDCKLILALVFEQDDGGSVGLVEERDLTDMNVRAPTGLEASFMKGEPQFRSDVLDSFGLHVML